MRKTSDGLHWTLVESVNGQGQRVMYVKIFGQLPASPIKVSIVVSDKNTSEKFQTISVDACSGVDSIEDVLESGKFFSVYDSQLTRWNGGNEMTENGQLKNLTLRVTLAS